MNSHNRVARWASTRHVIGTGIPLPPGRSLITSAAQVIAVAVTATVGVSMVVWLALLATGMVQIAPNPGLFGGITAWNDAMGRVGVIVGYVVLLDLLCMSLVAAIHVHAALTPRPTSPDLGTFGEIAAVHS